MCQMYVTKLVRTGVHVVALQVSELELDIVEVDPETKEMLKSLVRSYCTI